MKTLRVLAFAATAIMASATWAAAQEAFTTGDVNLRAGPGSRYPVVTTIPEDREVFIHGCLANWDWCDVSWRRNRGWVFSDYLEGIYRDRRVGFYDYRGYVDLPVVSFGFGYWDRYYRDRPWFDDWDHWHVRLGNRDRDWDRDRDDDWDGNRRTRMGDRDGDRDDDWDRNRRTRMGEREGEDDEIRRGSMAERCEGPNPDPSCAGGGSDRDEGTANVGGGDNDGANN